MKQSILATLLLLAFSTASALPLATPQPPKMRQLLKCNSIKNGTLWASFGRMWASDAKEPQTFPTELVVFANDYSGRIVPTLTEALNIPVNVRESSMSLEFTIMSAAGNSYKHLVQVMIYDARDPNGYVGNWKVTDPNGAESIDSVACSIF